MVQKRNIIVREEHKALIAFTIIAAFSGEANIVKNLAMSWKTGFPGGCPISSLYEEAINSPQSQKLVVGSIVDRYTTEETIKRRTPAMLSNNLNLFISICSYPISLRIIDKDTILNFSA